MTKRYFVITEKYKTGDRERVKKWEDFFILIGQKEGLLSDYKTKAELSKNGYSLRRKENDF